MCNTVELKVTLELSPIVQFQSQLFRDSKAGFICPHFNLNLEMGHQRLLKSVACVSSMCPNFMLYVPSKKKDKLRTFHA